MITHNMPRGEYFLIEYRGDCGFDAELRHYGDDRGRDRKGAAVWHVDESNLMSGITYTSEGYPGDGKNPRMHYKVALAQADGDWDLEKGLNRGDGTDLFRKSNDPWSAKVAYKISSQGLTLNNGEVLGGVSTKSYAQSGAEKYTGITIEFGEATSTMTMKVTLDGAPKPAPTKAPTLPPPTTRPPTPYPTPVPTPRPTEFVARNGPDVPRQCAGAGKKNSRKKVCFTGVGRKKQKVYYKSCFWLKKKKNIQGKVCGLIDMVSGRSVREVCGSACP